jgi:hypothetical protein
MNFVTATEQLLFELRVDSVFRRAKPDERPRTGAAVWEGRSDRAGTGGLLIALSCDGDHCNFGKRGVKYKLRHGPRAECGRKKLLMLLVASCTVGGLGHPGTRNYGVLGSANGGAKRSLPILEYDNVAARPLLLSCCDHCKTSAVRSKSARHRRHCQRGDVSPTTVYARWHNQIRGVDSSSSDARNPEAHPSDSNNHYRLDERRSCLIAVGSLGDPQPCFNCLRGRQYRRIAVSDGSCCGAFALRHQHTRSGVLRVSRVVYCSRSLLM